MRHCAQIQTGIEKAEAAVSNIEKSYLTHGSVFDTFILEPFDAVEWFFLWVALVFFLSFVFLLYRGFLYTFKRIILYYRKKQHIPDEKMSSVVYYLVNEGNCSSGFSNSESLKWVKRCENA